MVSELAVTVFKSLTLSGKLLMLDNFVKYSYTKNMETNFKRAKEQSIYIEFDDLNDNQEKNRILSTIRQNPNMNRLGARELVIELTDFIINNKEFNATEMDAIFFQRTGNPILCLANKKKINLRFELIKKKELTDMELSIINDGVCIFIELNDIRNVIQSYATNLKKLSNNGFFQNYVLYGTGIAIMSLISGMVGCIALASIFRKK